MPSPLFVAFDHRVQRCTRDFQLLTFASCIDKIILNKLHKFLCHLTHITSISESIESNNLGQNIKDPTSKVSLFVILRFKNTNRFH